MAGSGDDIEGSGDNGKDSKNKGDRIVSSGDGARGDDEEKGNGRTDDDEVYSGSGSGDGPGRYRPEVYPPVDNRPTPKYPTYTKKPDDDVVFTNPKYNVNKPGTKDGSSGGTGSAAASVSSSALLIVSAIFAVVRIVV